MLQEYEVQRKKGLEMKIYRAEWPKNAVPSKRIGSMRLMEKGQILGFRHVFRTIEVEVCHAI